MRRRLREWCSIWSSNTPEHASLCIQRWEIEHRALLKQHLHALAPNQQTTSILLRQAPVRSTTLVMGRRHVHHCEQHEGFLWTNFCNGKHGGKSFPAANQPTPSAGCGVLWHCVHHANSHEKEAFQKCQSNASQSQLFLLMCCFVVKLFQEN